ncbi:hypothetical protein V6R21_06860 [Limibacter armeniacum]|uniref:hypothetical protein n=1 Tax=Limibacter armeniacum TaxID=466084 RepID=UPI002FE6AC03
MNILYLVFGDNIQNHKQANFSIYTFLLQKDFVDHIIIVTDAPSYYSHLKDSRVIVKSVDEQTLNDWRGPYDFFWRIKIKAVEAIAYEFKDTSLLYLDSDTFLYGDLAEIKNRLDKGFNTMHLNEGKLSELGSKTEKKMWDQSNGKSFGGVTINAEHCMWNAGVIGISHKNFSNTIPLSLSICDDMCKGGVTRRLIEQFAFSVALCADEDTPMVASDDIIGHYWGNKEGWNEVITSFFVKAHLGGLTQDEELEELRKMDLLKIPVKVGIPNTRKRLHKLIMKWFPDKGIEYIQ